MMSFMVNNPSDLPDPSSCDRVEEPYIKATIITKADFVGNVMSLCIEKRGHDHQSNLFNSGKC